MGSYAWTVHLDRLLRRVEKPGRYTGGETHQTVKDCAGVKASIVLAFPDLYDIGMSYHGFKILYERVNGQPNWAAERAFAPWPDMEQAMRREGIPLYALESKRPVADFDLIGFTLQHEVNYTNVLNMLDLAGLPVEASNRLAPFPLVIGGGEGAYNPEPLSLFFDLFVVGDGEEALDHLMQLVEQAKMEGAINKEDLLSRAARVPGVYVPSHYEAEYRQNGWVDRYTVKGAKKEIDPKPIRKVLFDLRRDLGPVMPIIPNLRVIHDRLGIEIKRGCTRGCRFCSAGMITRPVRERTPDQILEIARSGLRHTGFDDIALLSLSSADYSCILPAVRLLRRNLKDRKVSISLPSLRINAFDVALAEEIAQVRKTGFTFAPEAGTERLRKVINKGIDQESFLEIVDQVYRKGWKTLKFYFMIGLPTETDEDLDGIVDLVRRAEKIGFGYWGRGLRINVGLSPFVPKAHTPFQWTGQIPIEEMRRRFEYIDSRLRGKCIGVRCHDPRLSFIESALARGDRRMGAVLRRAWELGCRFDGWDEYFRFDSWLEAFRECGIDPAFYANRERGADEAFPWEIVEPGLGRGFLWREWQAALQERETPDCSTERCAGCEACGEGTGHALASKVWESPRELLEAFGFDREKPARFDGKTPPRPSAPPVQRLRFHYSRTGSLKYLSHLDIIKILQMACLRAGLNPAYSEGFHPTPKMQFLPPLPLGFQSRNDLLDVQVTSRLDPEEAARRMNEALPVELRVHQVLERPLYGASPEVCLKRSEFEIALPADLLMELHLPIERIEKAFEAFRVAETVSFERPAKRSRAARMQDLKKSVLELGNPVRMDNRGIGIRMVISHDPDHYADPLTALGAILGKSFSFADGADAVRTNLFLQDPE